MLKALPRPQADAVSASMASAAEALVLPRRTVAAAEETADDVSCDRGLAAAGNDVALGSSSAKHVIASSGRSCGGAMAVGCRCATNVKASAPSADGGWRSAGT